MTGALVATALSRAGLTLEAAQIDVPSSLSAANEEPQLQVTTADLLPDGRLRVRLACRQAGVCMPFLAIVRLSSAAEGLTALESLQKALGTVNAAAHPSPAGRVLAGQHVTMRLEDNRMRIVLEVISIDSGAQGTEIRVSSLDRKQTFRATVVDAGTVRGALP